MIKGIHHINFLVKDLSKNVDYLTQLLNQTPQMSRLPKRNVATATFNLNGIYIVLVSPLSEEGEPARILAERGEGLFLLSFETLSLEDTLNHLESKGIHTSSELRRGLMDWSVIDLLSPSGLGPIIQLCESPSSFSL